ncbi:1-aminocyclopropane-1-carboxylate deaminase/D-cysteine desulfhydrase [Salinithrix halophila]|uniref:1-aminocyclopropane-1-carboxylate deaminase/D-cysteine desulfhydrase n=1 Tax=Salinithrix halophila TaxID=1485204 RepID=A0ABV8JHR5_9BACL
MSIPFPRVQLLWGETPLHPLPRLAAAAGLPEIWVKRDDLTGTALGGNKLRKLEFLLGEAKETGCDLVITGGSPQSNHARLTAGAARRVGLDAWLCFAGDRMGTGQGNLLLDRLFGAQCFLTGVYGSEALEEAMEAKAEEVRSQGRRPFVIPVGGSTPAGDYGYVLAWKEWAAQQRQSGSSIDTIWLSAGTGGTMAGLLAGRALSPLPVNIRGISAWLGAAELRRQVARLANQLLERLGSEKRVQEREVEVSDGYIGRKYGAPSEEGNRAIRLLAETEGLVVDPVYTGKALAGMMDLASSSERALFWHTGGSPAVFTHGSTLWREFSDR